MPRLKPINVEQWHHDKTWTAAHRDTLTFGQRIADSVAAGMGSWTFIIMQTVIVAAWMTLNVIELTTHRWDPYPFILLNLLFSIEAAYTGPIIMMSQNRAAERDRFEANADYQTNLEAKQDIENVQRALFRIENEKVDRVLAILTKLSGDASESAPEA